jgi:acylphosphatase
MSHFERRTVLYQGRVQGVGFRATTKRIATAFQVGGSVQNLPDGSVQVIAEGEIAEVSRFLDAIAREFKGYIRNTVQSGEMIDQPPTTGFRIAY